MSTSNERDKLLQAKDLVSQKRYDEARAILVTMPDNPTAQKWLNQLASVGGGTPAPRPAPPPAQSPYPPPSPYGPGATPPPAADLRQQMMSQDKPKRQMPNIQADQMQRQAQETLARFDISLNTAVLVLIIAAVSGILAALIDNILGLPWGFLNFTFGWFAAILSGMTYPMIKGKADMGGLIVAAVAGLVTMLLWFILAELIIGDKITEATVRSLYRYWFNEYMNPFKAILAGIVLGIIGFGWYALIPFLRSKLQPLLPDLER